uniref:Uncharacterized protein n=1 Tax=Oryza sativa subsp. japonica TaxID=39947 RepID=Q6AU75_ORYSJ|nr:hypothetical protein [Oryza sativa Japonica Group]
MAFDAIASRHDPSTSFFWSSENSGCMAFSRMVGGLELVGSLAMDRWHSLVDSSSTSHRGYSLVQTGKLKERGEGCLPSCEN